MTGPVDPTQPPGPPDGDGRKSWQSSTAPRFIGLFLWVVYFDQLGRQTLATGGLMPSVLGALVAGILCTVLLYHVPAMWGFHTGQPLSVLGTSTFGASGSIWMTGVLIALGQVVWFAVATSYATELTFQGLVSCRLLDPRNLAPIQLAGLRLPSILFLITSLAWSYAAALVGHYLLQIIAALMNVYPVFMAIMLGIAMLWTLRSVPQFRPLEIDPATSAPIRDGGLRAFGLMIELVFGFFATGGLLSADWGATNRTERDVHLGGWIGVALASWTVATLALFTVAGAAGMSPGHGLKDFTFQAAVLQGVGGTLGGTILLILGLGSLAQTCYAAYLFGHGFAAAWPSFSRLRWTLLATGAAWLLQLTGLPARLETIFSLMGAVFGPMVAAMAADYVRHRGGWPGPRQGVNLPGLLAWAAGLAVGLVPIVAGSVGWEAGTRFQPAAVFAFFTSFVVYLILAGLGAEAPALPTDVPASDPASRVEVA
jgi:cytosine permease